MRGVNSRGQRPKWKIVILPFDSAIVKKWRRVFIYHTEANWDSLLFFMLKVRRVTCEDAAINFSLILLVLIDFSRVACEDATPIFRDPNFNFKQYLWIDHVWYNDIP